MVLLNSNNNSNNMVKFVHPHIRVGKPAWRLTQVTFGIADQGWFNAMVQNATSALAVMM
jgi:hypothetical protein